MSTRYRRKQIAIRRLQLNQKGQLNPDARVLAVELKKLCGGALTQYDRAGAVDPVATAAAAQRREIWDHLGRRLHLEPYEAANLREEEQ